MKRRDILLLLGSSVFLVIIWIIFSIIHQLVSSTINQTVNEAITPITPSFDVAVINTLKTRINVAPDFSAFSSTLSSQQISPTPLPPAFIASPSAVPTVSLETTPAATSGGSTK